MNEEEWELSIEGEDRIRICDRCFDTFPESKLTHVGELDAVFGHIDKWYCDHCFEELTGLIRRRLL